MTVERLPHMMACDEESPGGDTRIRILRLDISGFRSLKEVSWTPGDLNVVIGPETRAQAPEFAAIELDRLAVKGKKEAVTIHGLLGPATMAQSALSGFSTAPPREPECRSSRGP